MISRRWALSHAEERVELAIGRLRRGSGDPTHRRLYRGCWLRATRTPNGPALVSVRGLISELLAQAWGPGAEWALDQAPRLLGEHDRAVGFEPAHPLLRKTAERHPWLRVGATDRVCEAIAPACLEQVVTGKEAFGAFRRLVRKYGEPAPGPATDDGRPPMMLPPTPAQWAAIPSWEFLAAGVEERRSRPLVRAMGRAAALERTLGRPDADRALQSLPGVGPWTSAEVRQRAHGDADAWSVGDFHVGRAISYALVGEELDDDAVEEILAPYRGHRYRVQLLIERSGVRRERRGPRVTLPGHTPFATGGAS